MTTTPTIQTERTFGVLHILVLGILLFMGALCAVPLQQIPALQSLPVPSFIATALWGLEVVLFALFAFLWTRQPLLTVIGIGLGVFTRLLANLLLLLLLPQRPIATLFTPDSAYWLYHLWAIILTCLAFVLAYKALIEDLNGLLVPKVVKASAPKQFAFNAKPTAPPPDPHPVAKPVAKPATPAATSTPIFLTEKKAPEKVSTILAPPEGFVPVALQNGVNGTVSVPAKVILESVPEAKNLLMANSTIHVPLGYITPQLPRGAAWLTWHQVFERGLGVTEQGEGRKDVEFQNRWVCIPPQYFVTQISQSFFTSRKTPPRWMSLPEVPQEAEIKFE